MTASASDWVNSIPGVKPTDQFIALDRRLFEDCVRRAINAALLTPDTSKEGADVRAWIIVEQIASGDDSPHRGEAQHLIALRASQPPEQAGMVDAERRGEKRAIARLVAVARDIGWQAGVGARETAGAIVSYLATSPDEIAPFMAGDLSPIDFAGDWMRGGCLTWQTADGKVWSPEEAEAAREAKAAAQAGTEK